MNQSLHVQFYLKSGKTLEELKTEHGVKSFCQNGKITLTYDQIEALENDPLSQQCRGLILRDQTYDIVAAPMFRFFNLEQKAVVADIDWNSATIEEKLDGTLIIVYFDTIMNRWYCATRSRPEADVPIDTYSLTFSDLFQKALEELFPGSGIDLQKFMAHSSQNKTFCFELCTPLNRIVCLYPKFFISLLAVRDNNSLLEEDPQLHSKNFNLPEVKQYSFSSIEALLEIIREWNPTEHEGVVVKDANFNRAKIKSPAYVAYNHIRDKLSTSIRGCLEIILLEKDDDVVAMLPEFIANRIAKIKSALQILITETQAEYDRLKSIDDMKEFALAAQQTRWPSVLFMLKRGKIASISDFLRQCAESNASLDTVFNLCKKIDSTLGSI